MKLIKSIGWGVAVLLAGSLVTACASYYRVVEPQSGRTYYTQDVEQDRSGAVKFKDAGSGAVVTIQNSEVKEVSGKEFDAGLAAEKTKPATAPSSGQSDKSATSADKSATSADKNAAPAEESK
jgi:hypothetical protein